MQQAIETSRRTGMLVLKNLGLTTLPEIPSWVTVFNCMNNNLTELPRLPDGLLFLFCGNNQLTKLPALPDQLTTIECENNQITKLPSLPKNLGTINLDGNPLNELYKRPYAHYKKTQYTLEEGGGIQQFKKDIQQIRAIPQNLESVETIGRQKGLPSDVANTIGTFLSGVKKPLPNQKKSIGGRLGGSRKRRKHSKKSRKSRKN